MNQHKNTFQAPPKDGLAGMKENWKSDLTSGFLVFLIALPLCLGIAMASGFPPIAGILTAVIGGLVVGPIMGAPITIKGPAAGLIAISMAAVAEFGAGNAMLGYQMTLAAIVVAGIIQVLFGVLKLGRFVDFFPTAAVHGMLAAIGIIIVAKQLPFILGVPAKSKSIMGLMAEIPSMFGSINPEIVIIGGLSLLIMFGLPLIKVSWVKKIPAPMVVLLVAMPLGRLFDLSHEHEYLFLDHHYHVGPSFLVTLPDQFAQGFVFPDFSGVLSLAFLKYVVMFALVGSLESLLTVKAIDGLDPYHRRSNANRDLLAVGIGNTIAGFIGGLPMIAEVVRSSANVNNGAKTRWSNFYHGFFLLVFAAFFPNLLHQIPLSALAAMLIYAGFRLASPKLFRETYKIGWEQLAVFMITIALTLVEDLLVGIAAGIVLEIAFNMMRGVSLKDIFKAKFQQEETDDDQTVRLKAPDAAVFTNYMAFKRQLESIPDGKTIQLDFAESQLVDHTFMEQIKHLKHEYELKGGKVDVVGLDAMRPVADHALSARRASRYKDPSMP